MNKVIGIIAGSLRKGSFSKMIAATLVDMAPAGYEFRPVPIDGLEVYNQDFDEHHEVPPSYTRFRGRMGEVAGVIFVTPEHNRSVPAALKNAIDVGSRPRENSVWNGKPAAVFSNSPGNMSAFGANHHLRQSLVFLNMPVMQQPEVYIANVNKLVGADGKVSDPATRDFLQKAVDAYIAWFAKNSGDGKG